MKSEHAKKEEKHTILIVEDEQTSYFYLQEVLKNSNYHMVLALDGLEAVRICKENHSIDLVLMDIKIPLLNGYEATREIKKIRPDLPVIAQTAYAMPGDHEKAVHAGCDDYLTKPVEYQKLMAIIRQYLG